MIVVISDNFFIFFSSKYPKSGIVHLNFQIYFCSVKLIRLILNKQYINE